MRKPINGALFLIWTIAFAGCLFGSIQAFGISWWYRIDFLLPVRLWVLLTPFLIFSGRLTEGSGFGTISVLAIPWLCWLSYFLFVDGKSLYNLAFLDSNIVAVVCFMGLVFRPQKGKALLLFVLAILIELVGIWDVVRNVPTVGE